MNSKLTLKNITFAIGLSWLIFGALTYGIRDWDIGVSLVMAGFTYASADWVVGVLWRRQYKEWLKAAFLTWFSVSGCYTVYWLLAGHRENMVADQWQASLCLYLLAGFIWMSGPAMLREGRARFRPIKGRFWNSR